MRGALVQEWITLKGGAGTSVIQGVRDYLDAAYLQDLVFWIDVRTATGSAAMNFETAPLKEDALFALMVPAVSLAVGASIPTTVLAQDAIVPPGRWVRWRISSASAWSVSFRLFLSANQVGP
jgi:hypothetical protein